MLSALARAARRSVAALALVLASPVAAQQAADAVAPEARSTVPDTGMGGLADRFAPATLAAMAAKDAGQPVAAQDWMIAVAHPLAAEAGAEILRAGGTAADAMVAAQAVLGLVEPQSSGLGGGAFLVWYDAKSGALTTLDGRETAPLSATPDLFLDDAGAPLKFFDAVVGGLSVGTPGTPALMHAAHERWGKTAWTTLFDRAIALADNGFAVSPRLAGLIARDAERLARDPRAAAYFLPKGAPLAVGDIRDNSEYGETLRALATRGAAAFYSGKVAQDIIETVQNAPRAGRLAPLDLAIYRVKERPPVCAPYRVYEVCGMGPPSSGGLTVGQILGMLNAYDLAALGPENAHSWRLIGDASRLAFADRGRYMADSDFVPMPTKGLTEAGYLATRSALMAEGRRIETAPAGHPKWDHAQIWADDEAIELPSTTHMSIVDRYGNALSMTSTVENAFGSRLMTAGGFLLNNEMTDFSFRSHNDGVPIANRVEPGKRPRSSMAPTIVMKDGVPVLVIGSPGGSRIIGYVAQAIIAWADWGMDVQSALAMPHLVNRFGIYDVEEGTAAEAQRAALQEMGYEVTTRDLNSGLHAIEMRGGRLSGGADPRREGVALGE
ncbi:gamma-glutamyltransferase [Rhodobacterales bacterium 59_46_T64]|nr:gamma-glutamyltransferase [Rhodobacterales bacterium 59_46_T64]